jgi:hypothetical protein
MTDSGSVQTKRAGGPRANDEGRQRRAIILFGLGVLVHLFALSSLVTGVLDPLFVDTTHRLGKGADFYAVYQAGQNVKDGISVYEWNRDTSVVPYWYPYRYAPPLAQTFGVLATNLSPQVAYRVWVGALEGLLLLNLWLTRRMFPERHRAMVAMSLWLLFSPYYLEIYLGQFSFVMATLLFWMIHWWYPESPDLPLRRRLGDAAWIASLLVKANSALIAPVLLKAGRWRLVVMAGAVVGAMSLPYFLVAPGSLEIYARNVTDGLTADALPGNLGLSALVATAILRLGGSWPTGEVDLLNLAPALTDAIRLPLTILSLVVGLATIILTIRANRRNVVELILAWTLVHFLVYKHVWEHHYVMAIPVFVLLYRGFASGPDRIRVSPRLFWATFWIMALPTPFVFIDVASAPVDPLSEWTTQAALVFHAGKPLAALALYLGLFTALWASGAKPISRPEPAG